MVRKVGIYFATTLLIWATLTSSAKAANVYQGTISTTYLTFFRDVVSNLPITDDYVLFRSGESEYTLVAGELKYDGTFRLDGQGKEYVITNVTGSNYSNNYYSYKVTDISTFTLNPSNYMVYSNLGEYPILEERSVGYAFTTYFVLVVIGLCAFIRPILTYSIRNRT